MKVNIETTVEMVEVDGYIWCQMHGSIHDDCPDPYMEGIDCSSLQFPVYAEKENY